MIKSMTGFGRCEIEEGSYKISVELKAVNHRYLDLNVKMPKKFNAFDAAVRKLLKKYIERGKVDVYISFEDHSEDHTAVYYNREIADTYMKYLNQMAEDFGLDNDVRVSGLSRYPEVFTMEELSEDEEELWSLLEKALIGAAEHFVAAREKEGEALYHDLTDKLNDMIGYVDFIEERYPKVVAEYREKLEQKVAELLGDVHLDEARMATEITLYADKICVDEETVRLRTHIQSTLDTLKHGGACGRKLDFIAQELNRESNTILSKSTDIDISNVAINLKTDVEKVREQIQNIE